MKDITITGVLTAPRKFTISYSKGKEVTNYLHTDYKSICDTNSIPIHELTTSMNDKYVIETIKSWNPEFILVAGWYHMVPKEVLVITRKGVAGLHASLLPKYRGGAPLVWAIINGEKETGISFFYFDNGVDSGDIIAQRKLKIEFNDTIRTVYQRIEELGIDIIRNMVPLIANNCAPRKKQNNLSDYEIYPQRCPDDGLINWKNTSMNIYNFIRAQTKPYPGAFTYFKGMKVIIWESKLVENIGHNAEPGEVIAIKDSGSVKGILVASLEHDRAVLITEVQENGQLYSGIDFSTKYEIAVGDKFHS